MAQEGHDSKDSSRTSSVEAADPAKGQTGLQVSPGGGGRGHARSSPLPSALLRPCLRPSERVPARSVITASSSGWTGSGFDRESDYSHGRISFVLGEGGGGGRGGSHCTGAAGMTGMKWAALLMCSVSVPGSQ